MIQGRISLIFWICNEHIMMRMLQDPIFYIKIKEMLNVYFLYLKRYGKTALLLLLKENMEELG